MVEYQSWSDMVERIERRVIELLQSKIVKSGNPKVSIFQLFGYAAIIHIYMFMRDIPRGLPFFILISGRLRSSIEALNLEQLHKVYPEMVIWILLMGGLGSSGGPNRGWYAKRFAETCMAAGLRGGNSIAYALAEYLWSDLYRSPVTIGFWNEAARAQGMNGGSFDVKRITDHLSVAAFNAPPEMVGEVDE
jgi:transcription factor-like protein